MSTVLRDDKAFWRNVVGRGGCWVWRGPVIEDSNRGYQGYPVVLWTPRPMPAIRYALTAAGRKHETRHIEPSPNCRWGIQCVNPWDWIIGNGEISPVQERAFACLRDIVGADYGRSGKRLGVKESICIFLARELIQPQLSWPQIGKLIGRHHSVALYNHGLIEQRDPMVWRDYARRAMREIGGVLGGLESAAIAA